jgi:HEAT repeat protein
MDSRAVPILVHVLRRKENGIDQAYDRLYHVLNLQRFKALPQPSHYEVPRSNAATTLASMGTSAAASTQYLIQATKDPSEYVRNASIRALKDVAPKSPWEPKAVEALVQATEDSAMSCRQQALVSLGSFTNQPDLVVPALIKGLIYPTAENCINSLERIGPAAIPALVKTTQNERSWFRPAEVALEKIDPLLADKIKTTKLEAGADRPVEKLKHAGP